MVGLSHIWDRGLDLRKQAGSWGNSSRVVGKQSVEEVQERKGTQWKGNKYSFARLQILELTHFLPNNIKWTELICFS